MFISIKRKVSSALMNAAITVIFILACYLAKHVAVLYQQYQKADRLNGYLGDLEEVITRTHRLQSGVEGLGEQFSIVQKAVRGSLSIDLKHDSGGEEDVPLHN